MASALLAVAGLGLAAAPAQAAAVMYPGACNGGIGGTLATNFPVSCTNPTFGVWDALGSQVHHGEVVVHNHASYAVRVIAFGDSSLQGSAPGDLNTYVEVPAGGVVIPPGDLVQIPIKAAFVGPFTSAIRPAGHGIPIPTVRIRFRFRVATPAGQDLVAGGADYQVYPNRYPPGSHVATYGVAPQASRSFLPAGQASVVTARNTASVPEHITLCDGSRKLAAGIHPPGSSLVHPVTFPTAGARTLTAYASNVYACSGTSSTVTVTWTAQLRVPVPPNASPVALTAVNPSPAAHASDTLVAVNTNPNAGEWMTICQASRALGSGWRPPGGAVEHAVIGAGAETFVAQDR
ncbi:MAG: hypothetical protein M0T80_12325, partial [Actinomycetota bacterium]|nr:hypothetical protein [Actinomycetota bacterium]